jgi:hypothetical protein
VLAGEEVAVVVEINSGGAPGKNRVRLLTQNLHLAPSTQQAEQAGFTREEITRRASQFSLKLTKVKVVKFQSLELARWYQTDPYLRL